MSHHLRAAANVFTGHLGLLLMLFGLGLVVVGGGVKLVRHVQLRNARAASPAPDFAATLHTGSRAADGWALADRSPTAVFRVVRMPSASPVASATPASSATPRPSPNLLIIPAISLVAPVVPVGWEPALGSDSETGTEWVTAEDAVGFHSTSARPGETGNLVLSGHNNVGGAVFKDLHRLQRGEQVFLLTGKVRHAYVVDANFILEEAGADAEQRRRNARWIGPTPDERLTLVTCYPPWGNTHRTIVIARPALATVDSPEPEAPTEPSEPSDEES